MDRNCRYCGAQLPEEASLCPHCAGSQIEKQKLIPPRRSRKALYITLAGVIVMVLVALLAVFYFNGWGTADVPNKPAGEPAESPPTQSTPEVPLESSGELSAEGEPDIAETGEQEGAVEPTPTPTSTPAFELAEGAIKVNYKTNYINRDGTTCDGVLFTGVSAVKLADGNVRFTVGLDLEIDFWVSVFEPPNGPWKWGYEKVPAGKTEFSFDLEMPQLQELSAITVKVYQEGNSDRAWLQIPQEELRQIEERLEGADTQIFPSVGESVLVKYGVDYLNADGSLCEDARFTGLTATQMEYGNVCFTVSFELKRPMTLAVTGDWGRVLEYLEADETSFSFTLTPKELGMGGNLGIKLYCGPNGELGVGDEIRTSLFVGETTIKSLWD